MKILLIQDDCSVGGHTNLRMENARGLAARGHDVSAFFFNDCGCLASFGEACPAIQGDTTDLNELIRRERFDVVHGDASMIDLPVLLRRAGFRGRLILTRHAVDSPVGWLAADCDGYVAESKTSFDLMQPFTDMTVDIVPNGIDTAVFRPVPCQAPTRPIVAWCGRSQSPFKNLGLYLRVTAGMNGLEPQTSGRSSSTDTASLTPYDFWIADGDGGPSTTPVYAGPTNHITSWRRYRRDEFPAFYSQVAASGGCLLVTSLYEGLPLTLLEALACGCPVVAMDSRGVNDIMTGPLAQWLYSPWLSADGVRRFVTSSLPSLHRHGICSSFRQHVVNNFSVDVMVEGNLAVYAGLNRGEPPVRSSTSKRCESSPRRQAHRLEDRSRIADRLWEHGMETLRKDGRPRDALFAMRSAVRIDSGSILRQNRLPVMMGAINRSRLDGARACLERTRQSAPAQRATSLLRAFRIHPGVVFDWRPVHGVHQ